MTLTLAHGAATVQDEGTDEYREANPTTQKLKEKMISETPTSPNKEHK